MGALGRAACAVAIAVATLGMAGVAPVGVAPVGAATKQATAGYGEGAALNVPVVSTDGTVLRADVYYPKTCNSPCSTPAAYAGGFPVLLQQTPYGKQDIEQEGTSFGTPISSLVTKGYVVVISDVRGTGTSGGSWGLLDPIQQSDGAVLARWAANDLPAGGRNGTGISSAVHGLTVNGEVGLFGESYMGINEFLTVNGLDSSSGPNPVRAMFPIITGNDLFRDIVAQGGLFNVEFSALYLALLDGLGTAGPAFDAFESQYTAWQLDGAPPSTLATDLANFPVLAAGHAKQVTQYDVPTVMNVETGGNEAFDAGEGFGTTGYWAQRNPVNVLQQVVSHGIATFLVGGWNDLFQRGELMNYMGLQNAWYDQTTGATESLTGGMAPGQPASPRYQLLMGPWTHLTAGSGTDMAALELEWFDSYLDGPAHQASTALSTTTTPLHLFEMGSGQWNAKAHTGTWVDTADWPIPDAGRSGYSATKLFFGPRTSSAGTSLSDNGGSLSTAAPTAPTGADTVVYTGASSPCDLNTDQWGAGFLQLGQANLGSGFQWPCDTNDVTFGAGPGALTYTSGPVGADALIAGPVDVTMFATSTTTDTELVADVEEVGPSGQSVALTTGALLGSLRAEDAGRTITGDDGAPLEPFHVFTSQSARPVTRGAVTRYDLEVFPTFALVPKGWRIRVTISTSDTPHMLPSLVQGPKLLGGVYRIERNSSAASFVNLPLVSASSFSKPCPAAACPAS